MNKTIYKVSNLEYMNCYQTKGDDSFARLAIYKDGKCQYYDWNGYQVWCDENFDFDKEIDAILKRLEEKEHELADKKSD